MNLAMRNKIVEHRLFRTGSRPHVLSVYPSPPSSDDDIGWVDAHLDELIEHGFGVINFHGRWFENGERPVNGHYVYSNYAMAKGIFNVWRRWREKGFVIQGYFHPRFWREAGLTPLEALEEIRQHEWDGVLLDGVDVHNSMTITRDFLVRLRRMMRGSLTDHCSIMPWGLGSYRVDWSAFFDYTIVNENKPIPTNASDWRWVISAASYSNAIALPKFPGEETDELARAIKALPCWLCSLRASRGFWYRMFLTHYLPVWRDLCEQWRRENEHRIPTIIRPQNATEALRKIAEQN